MSNLRRPLLEIPTDFVATPEVRRFLAELNQRFKIVAEQHEASAGLRGTVRIAAQKKTDERNVTLPGLMMGANRIGNAADPVDLQDGLTFGYLNKWLTCERLVGILDDCFEFEELLDHTLDPDALPAASPGTYQHATYTHAIRPTQATDGSGGSGNTDAANECWAFLFNFPVDLTVSKVVFGAAASGAPGPKLSIGLYDLAGTTKVLDTGVFNVLGSNFDVSTNSFAPVNIKRGMYYLAFTGDSLSLPSLDKLLMNNKNLANFTTVKEGKATATVGGVLNATLGTITPFTDTNAHSCPFVLFE